jgi:hypothetical protein
MLELKPIPTLKLKNGIRQEFPPHRSDPGPRRMGCRKNARMRTGAQALRGSAMATRITTLPFEVTARKLGGIVIEG